MSASRKSSTRSSSRPPQSPSLPEHVFTPEYLAHLAERDEPVTATEAELAIPWHVEPYPKEPKGRWAVLRLGESFEKSTRTTPLRRLHPQRRRPPRLRHPPRPRQTPPLCRSTSSRRNTWPTSRSGTSRSLPPKPSTPSPGTSSPIPKSPKAAGPSSASAGWPGAK